MSYISNLKFEQKPDYNYCRSLFDSYLKDKKWVLEDENWDWDIRREEIIIEKQRQAEENRIAALMRKNTKKGKMGKADANAAKLKREEALA